MTARTSVLARLAAATLWLAAVPAVAAPPTQPGPHKEVAFDTDVRTWVVPALRAWQRGNGSLPIGIGNRIVIEGADPSITQIAADLADGLQADTGLRLPVVHGLIQNGDIAMALDGAAPDQPEGYALAIDSAVHVRARTTAGLRYGALSVLQMLRRAPDGRSLPRGSARDWADQPVRAMFVDVGRKFYRVDELDDLMRQMAWLKLNTLGLHFTDWPAFRLRSVKFPGLADRLSYDRADVDHLERTAQRYGIMIIPEIDLPAHASALIRYRPSLAFKCESMHDSDWLTRSAGADAKTLAWTVDITRQQNRDFLQSVFREFVPWFRGEYFHIGGDEYQYDDAKNHCPELLTFARAKGLKYPGDVFVEWINETDTLVRSMGKKTAIWSWWRFKDDQTSIEPNKDILIYAWNGPRQADMLAKGYRMVVTPEDKLYVTPGIENWDGSGYGVVDTDDVYRRMPFPLDPNIAGYMVALWADAAESWTDRAMLARAYEPMAVAAERTWAGAASPTLDAFLYRLNQSGSAPR